MFVFSSPWPNGFGEIRRAALRIAHAPLQTAHAADRDRLAGGIGGAVDCLRGCACGFLWTNAGLTSHAPLQAPHAARRRNSDRDPPWRWTGIPPVCELGNSRSRARLLAAYARHRRQQPKPASRQFVHDKRTCRASRKRRQELTMPRYKLRTLLPPPWQPIAAFGVVGIIYMAWMHQPAPRYDLSVPAIALAVLFPLLAFGWWYLTRRAEQARRQALPKPPPPLSCAYCKK